MLGFTLQNLLGERSSTIVLEIEYSDYTLESLDLELLRIRISIIWLEQLA